MSELHCPDRPAPAALSWHENKSDLTRSPKIVVSLLAAIWLILSLNLFLAVGLFQPNVLAWDQWDFFAPLFNEGSWFDLFTYQHGPHRQGAGFVATSWILELTQWDARWDSLWIATLLSVASALGLLLKRKITGNLGLKDAWIPIVGLTLGQYESVLFVPNASHSAFPLVLILSLANAWFVRNPAVRYLASGWATIALIFTGFGLFAGAMMTLLLGCTAARHALRREWKQTAMGGLGFAIAVAGWAWFRIGYVFAPAVEGFRFPWTPVSEYFQFLSLMLLQPSGITGAGSYHYLAGGLLTLLVITSTVAITWKWIRTPQPSPVNDVILLLIGSGLLFVCNAAVGRVCLGVTAGMASRYVTLMFPLWLGIYFLSETSKRAFHRHGVAVAVWAFAFLPYRDMPNRSFSRWPGTLGATDLQYSDYEKYGLEKAAWVDAYLKTLDPESAQKTASSAVYPWPHATQMEEKLRYLRSRGLSFFAAEKSFLPGLLQTRIVWNEESPSSHSGRVVYDQTQLTFVTNSSGVMEMALSTHGLTPGGLVVLEIDLDGIVRTFLVSDTVSVVAVRVKAGFNRFILRRTTHSPRGLPQPNVRIGRPVFAQVPSSGALQFEAVGPPF